MIDKEKMATLIPSPVGYLKAVVEGGELIELSFVDEKTEDLYDDNFYEINTLGLENTKDYSKDSSNIKILTDLKEQLDKYWKGELKDFSLPLSIRGTDFQKKVYTELMNIPYGTTTTYREIARKIDNPKAVRAVGGANNSNSIAIIVPCHRVIGSDNSLVGYGGGLEKKKFLLELEGLSIENNKVKR